MIVFFMLSWEPCGPHLPLSALKGTVFRHPVPLHQLLMGFSEAVNERK